MPEDFDPNNVSQQDFQDKILRDCLKLTQIMTQNKAEFLGDRFRVDANKYSAFVEIDKFVMVLEGCAIQMNRRIFRTQEDIDRYYLEAKQQGLDVKGLGVSNLIL